MISKILANTLLGGVFRFRPSVLSNSFRFCTDYRRQESHPLRGKIMDLSSYEDFSNFFKEKKQQFDPSCYSIASRTLARISMDSRQIFNNSHRDILRNYVSFLQKVDIDALSVQEFAQILFLLRTIKLDQTANNVWVNSHVKTILSKADGKVKQIEEENNVNKLAFFYQDFAALNSRYAQNISKKIYELVKQSNGKAPLAQMSISEIILILKAMKLKSQYTFDEIFLLKNIVNAIINKHFAQLSYIELVLISTSINEVTSVMNNYELINQSLTEKIHKKVLENIDELDEKSIMNILQSKKTNNSTYKQIYNIIFQKIFQQIDVNGQSSFNELFTLRLFNGIADKLRLQSTTEQNQAKFFTFISKAINKTPRYIHSFVEQYITKSFFNVQQLKDLVNIFANVADYQFRLSLLFEISVRSVSVSKIINMEASRILQLQGKYMIMLVAVFQNLVKQNNSKKQFYVENIAKIKQKFFTLYTPNEDTFARFIFNLENKYYIALYRYFSEDIQRNLPNPFQTKQPEKYKSAYLRYLVYGASQNNFKYVLKALKSKIKIQDIENSLKTMVTDKSLNKDSYSNILCLCTQNIDLLLKAPRTLNILVRFLGQNIIKIFQQKKTDLARQKVWFLLNTGQETLGDKQFLTQFSPLLMSIIKSNSYDFSYSEQYKVLLVKLFKCVSGMNKHILISLVRDSLKLGVFKRQFLIFFKPEVRQLLTSDDNLMLKMIETNNFALEGIQLTKKNLYLFLFNKSRETNQYLQKNSGAINSIIGQMKIRQLWKCILHYRIGSRNKQIAILEELFKNLNKFNIKFEEFSAISVVDVLKKNYIQKGLKNNENVKIYVKKSLVYFIQNNKIGNMSLEEHINLIVAANHYMIRNDQYMHAVFQRFSQEYSIFTRELYLTCAKIGFEFNSIELDKLMTKGFFASFSASFSKSFNIFLLLEQKIQNPGTHLLAIISKYNELKENQNVVIFELFFEYFKITYPQETKNFLPNKIVAADFCRNINDPSSMAAQFRQVAEEVLQTKFEQHSICGNYYYSFKNYNFIFPSVTRYYGQNKMIKKVLKTVTGKDNFIALDNNRHNSATNIVKYLKHNYAEVFTNEVQEKMMKRFSEIRQAKKGQTAANQIVDTIPQEEEIIQEKPIL